MRHSAVAAALAVAAVMQFAAPAFAISYDINFGGKNPAPFLFDFDPITEVLSSPSPLVDWVSGGGELFEFNVNDHLPTTAPDCFTGPTNDARLFDCLIATGATDPGITHTWTITPGAGFNFLTNQVAALSLVIADAGGQVVVDSGATLGTGDCIFNGPPGFFPPPQLCGYAGDVPRKLHGSARASNS